MVTEEQVKSLGDPLEDHEVEWRAQRCGITGNNMRWAQLVPYLNKLSVIERLDSRLGPTNWRNTVEVLGAGVVATLSILIGGTEGEDAAWVSRSDGAGFTDIEAFKGGISDALKRAAVLWGIGRELGRVKEVGVKGERIHDGYPPDDGGSYVKFKIKPKTGQSFYAWCEAPSISGARRILEQKQEAKRSKGSGAGSRGAPEDNRIQGDEQAPKVEVEPFEDDIPF